MNVEDNIFTNTTQATSFTRERYRRTLTYSLDMGSNVDDKN